MLGGDFSLGDYLVWNEIPTVAGNLVGGLLFVGLTLYVTHARTKARRTSSPDTDTATVGAPDTATERATTERAATERATTERPTTEPAAV